MHVNLLYSLHVGSRVRREKQEHDQRYAPPTRYVCVSLELRGFFIPAFDGHQAFCKGRKSFVEMSQDPFSRIFDDVPFRRVASKRCSLILIVKHIVRMTSRDNH